MGEQTTSAGRDRPLVLIAEDEPDNQTILEMVVEVLIGAQAVLVANGLEVLEAVDRERPALVLLDLMMPLVDGFEVARRLKANPATAAIPVVAISALARAGDREDALAAGCDDFVRKPFELDDLERLLRSYLDGAQIDSPANRDA